MPDIKGKNILITGAGRGIGKRLALALAHKGAHIGLLARNKGELDLTTLEIQHSGGSAVRLRANVQDFEQVCAAVERMQVHFGPLNALVCAAGVLGPVGPFAQATPRVWADAMATNLVGVMHSVRAVLPDMLKREAGKILVLVGDGAAESRPCFSAEAASKAGVVRLVETIADEVRMHNVQLNCMLPGPTYTAQTDEVLQAGLPVGDRVLQEAQKAQRTGGTPPQKQLDLAYFLLSQQSNHITGRLIHVGDDWRRLRQDAPDQELFRLRRVNALPTH